MFAKRYECKLAQEEYQTKALTELLEKRQQQVYHHSNCRDQFYLPLCPSVHGSVRDCQ